MFTAQLEEDNNVNVCDEAQKCLARDCAARRQRKRK